MHTSRLFQRFAILAILVPLVAFPLSLGATTLTIGGFDQSRTLSTLSTTYSLYNGAGNGFATNGLGTELSSAANLAGYGVTGINLVNATNSVDANYLSGVDIFFTGLLDFAPGGTLSASEANDLLSFIAGGGVVIAHTDNSLFQDQYDPLLNPLGLSFLGANSPADSLNFDQPNHPIMNGPFGTVTELVVADSATFAPAAGNAQFLASYTFGAGALGISGPNGGQMGALIVFPDSEAFGLRNNNFQSIGGSPSDTRIAFNNTVAWGASIRAAVVPETSTWLLLLTGVALLRARRIPRRAKKVR